MPNEAKNTEGDKNKPTKLDSIKKYKFEFIIGIIFLSVCAMAVKETWFNNPLLEKPVETETKKNKVDLVKQTELEKKIVELKEKIEINKIAADYLNEQSNQLPDLKGKIEKITKYDWSLNQKQLLLAIFSSSVGILIACIINKGGIKKPKAMFALNFIIFMIVVLYGYSKLNENPAGIDTNISQLKSIEKTLAELKGVNGKLAEEYKISMGKLVQEYTNSSTTAPNKTLRILERRTATASPAEKVTARRLKYVSEITQVLSKNGLTSKDIQSVISYLDTELEKSLKNYNSFQSYKISILFWETISLWSVMILDLIVMLAVIKKT